MRCCKIIFLKNKKIQQRALVIRGEVVAFYHQR
jgi:hypothetical protein